MKRTNIFKLGWFILSLVPNSCCMVFGLSLPNALFLLKITSHRIHRNMVRGTLLYATPLRLRY